MISLFKHTCDIWEYIESVNEWGQITTEWVKVHSDLKCTFGRKSVSTITDTDNTKSLWRYTLHLPIENTVKVGSKIYFKEQDQYFKAQEGMKYELLKKQELELIVWQD